MSDTFRPIVRCNACECRQFLSPECRRCHKPLKLSSIVGGVSASTSDPVVIEKVVERVVEKIVIQRPKHTLPEGVSFGAKMPTLAELQAAAMEEALFRCDGIATRAADMLDIGKTTMLRYRSGKKDKDVAA